MQGVDVGVSVGGVLQTDAQYGHHAQRVVLGLQCCQNGVEVGHIFGQDLRALADILDYLAIVAWMNINRKLRYR